MATKSQKANLRILQTTAGQRVAAGARWLDENVPGWMDRIDLNSLRLSSRYECICGQVFLDADDFRSGYDYAARHLFSEANSWVTTLVGMKTIPHTEGSSATDTRAKTVSVALGFLSNLDRSILDTGDLDLTGANYVGFDSLQREWKTLIVGRRAMA